MEQGIQELESAAQILMVVNNFTALLKLYQFHYSIIVSGIAKLCIQ